MFAVRHHVKEYESPLQMGRGAVIGLTTGVHYGVFFFNKYWALVWGQLI